jgi:NADH:ubiquinone oxidoreductase subunit F (NADH-binding)
MRKPPPPRAAAARGVESFFSDLHAEPGAVRVCRGTACALMDRGGAFARLPHGTSARTAYCLGHCDRGPALLLPDGRVATGGAGPQAAQAPGELAPPSIRARTREPIVTARIGRGDFSELEVARGAGVYAALEAALARAPAEVLAAIERSGERGRGGAGFPTGTKWRRCAAAPGPQRVVIANGDEGDPGSFLDRVLLERDPHAVLEGMALCAYAVGAARGIAYVRSEYPHAQTRVRRAIEQARAAGLLGDRVAGSSFAFDVELVSGRGSYVCGEETALLESIEGGRGEVRLRPPYPAVEGLHGRPTVVNNVETLVNVPWIVARGADAYRALGTAESSGTKALCFSAGFARPGIVEVEFGASLRELVLDEAGGGAEGAPLAGVLLGGPMGSVVLDDEWEVPVCYSAMAGRGIALGHGGTVALPRDANLRALALHWLEFMTEESCGKCVPCRLGSRRALELARGIEQPGARERLAALLDVVAVGSLCAFGQLLPAPVLRLLELDAARGRGAGA